MVGGGVWTLVPRVTSFSSLIVVYIVTGTILYFSGAILYHLHQVSYGCGSGDCVFLISKPNVGDCTARKVFGTV